MEATLGELIHKTNEAHMDANVVLSLTTRHIYSAKIVQRKADAKASKATQAAAQEAEALAKQNAKDERTRAKIKRGITLVTKNRGGKGK